MSSKKNILEAGLSSKNTVFCNRKQRRSRQFKSVMLLSLSNSLNVNKQFFFQIVDLGQPQSDKFKSGI